MIEFGSIRIFLSFFPRVVYMYLWYTIVSDYRSDDEYSHSFTFLHLHIVTEIHRCISSLLLTVFVIEAWNAWRINQSRQTCITSWNLWYSGEQKPSNRENNRLYNIDFEICDTHERKQENCNYYVSLVAVRI